MKKNIGIVRNKTNLYLDCKIKIQRKKNRFQIVGKQAQDEQIKGSEQLLTPSSAASENQNYTYNYQEIYQEAKHQLEKVVQIQKLISSQAKARLTSFKQSDNAKYDSSIAKLSAEATNKLLQAQRKLKQLNNYNYNSNAEMKLVHNVEASLAQEIRQASRSLRQQEKQYFDRLRTYEKNTANIAIQLTPEERRSMKYLMEEQMEQEKNDLRNQNIEELVKSINKLSHIYKDLNQLVIEQGSLIDRIDINIDATFEHTKKAIVHLEGAQEASSSTFADRFIKILVVMILLTATMLSMKYMNKS